MVENFQSFLKLRPRSNWEACDSGILIWRNTIAYILFFFGIPLLLCIILLAFLNPIIHYFSVLILWWFKPFLDRFILQVISVHFFRSDTNFKTICRSLMKNIVNGLIGDITWRRLSMYRSARLPVRILEGNQGKIVAHRINNLKNGGLDFCALLTCLCAILEAVLLGGFALLVFSFAGEYADLTFDLIAGYRSQVSLVVLFLYALTIFIVEPLYMCMGFGLYINSRSIIEGWDIEWELNSFIKHKKTEFVNINKSQALNIILLVVSFFLLFGSIQPLQAETLSEKWYQNNSEEVPADILDNILSSKDFGQSQTRKWIRFKEMNFDDSPSYLNFDDLQLKEIIGHVLRTLLVVIIAAALIFAGYRLFKMRATLFQNKFTVRKKGSLPGFAEKENSEKLIGAANKFFTEGQIRKAWAACLSAVLGLYAEQGNINFVLNDTESDCLKKINDSSLWGKEQSAQLILRWINLAYAGIEAEPEQFHEAVSFYRELKNKLFHSGGINE